MSTPQKSTVTAPESPRPAPTATPLLESPSLETERDIDGAKGRQPAGSRSPSRSTAPGSAASDNRAAESATSDGASVVPSPTAGSLNLLQRLTAIANEVQVKATGNTGRQAGNQRAISIGDVDEALGPLFVKHGVVSDYEFKEAPTSFKLPTRDGEMTMWLVVIEAHVYNVDDDEEELQRTLSDIGSNPSAAVSFALKRWMRALFKLVEDDDQPESRPDSNGGHTQPRIAGQSKMNTAEQARITRLNETLPKPKGQMVLDVMLRDLPYEKALAHLSVEHEHQCGANCTHVTGGA